MSKVTLDRETFKALASDTRLDILRTLDGKKMSLKDICTATKLNKATLHEHLTKLNEAGLVKKKEREGHKWVYYKLTWKGESLLHPENTRIVVLFGTTFIALCVGIIQMFWYIKGTVMKFGYNMYNLGNEVVMTTQGGEYYLDSATKSASETEMEIADMISNTAQGDSNIILDLLDFKSMHSWGTQCPPSIPINGNLSMVGSESDTISGTLGIETTTEEGTRLIVDQTDGVLQAIYQNPIFLYIAIACFITFTVVLCIALWRYWENKTPKV